jgi:hypothetical protein
VPDQLLGLFLHSRLLAGVLVQQAGQDLDRRPCLVSGGQQAEIQALNMAQKAEAYDLTNDPAKLAAYLVRAAGNR